MVQRRAMMEGQAFATRMRDYESAENYAAQAKALSEALEAHWDSRRRMIVSSLESSRPGRSGIDSSIILASIHTDVPFGGPIDSFSPDDDRVLATIPKIVDAFNNLYQVNNLKQNTDGEALGPAIGRYPEDTYDGNGSSRGNPWFVCTSALAEFYYRLVWHYKAAKQITVSPLSLVFFNFIGVNNVESGTTYPATSPQFLTIVNTLGSRGDEIVRRIQFHSDKGRLREQFNRNVGFMQGAIDVTWTYAALMNTNRARNKS